MLAGNILIIIGSLLVAITLPLLCIKLYRDRKTEIAQMSDEDFPVDEEDPPCPPSS